VTEDLPAPARLAPWIAHYQRHAVEGVRTPLVAAKIALHLGRFQAYFEQIYGHDQLAACVRRDVLGWQAALRAVPLAPATVNNHLASLSGFTTWVHAQAPTLFAAGNPCRGIGELGLGPLEPRALTGEQVRSLKSVCDRLPHFHQLRGQPGTAAAPTPPTHHYARPWRNRAIVFVLLSTGLRREELTRLDLAQVVPATAAGLRRAHQGRLTRVRGKGHTERVVFLSADARAALADYLERERPGDAALSHRLLPPARRRPRLPPRPHPGLRAGRRPRPPPPPRARLAGHPTRPTARPTRRRTTARLRRSRLTSATFHLPLATPLCGTYTGGSTVTCPWPNTRISPSAAAGKK